MSVSARGRRRGRLAFAVLAGIGLCAAMLPAAPAEARVYVGIGVPGWPYYAPPPAYYYPYYGYYGPRPYYPYYGYYHPRPYYGYYHPRPYYRYGYAHRWYGHHH